MFYSIFTRGETCSESSTLRKNADRRISDTGNQAMGRKKDLLLVNGDNEYGRGEAGLKWMDCSKKVLSDKILKDIFWALSKKIENNENLARQLQKTGFAFNNKYLIFLQLVTLSWKLIVTISTTSRALFEPFHFGLSRWSYLMCQRHKDCDNPRTNGHNDQ